MAGRPRRASRVDLGSLTSGQKEAVGRKVADGTRPRTIDRQLKLPPGTVENLQRNGDPVFLEALECAQKVLGAGWAQVGVMALEEIHRRMSDSGYRKGLSEATLISLSSLAVQRAGDVDDRLRIRGSDGKVFEVLPPEAT